MPPGAVPTLAIGLTPIRGGSAADRRGASGRPATTDRQHLRSADRVQRRFFNQAWCESRCIGPATLVLQSASYVARSALKTEMRSRQSKASRTSKPPTRVGSLRVVEGLDDWCHGFDTGCCLVREVAANLVESGALESEECVGEFVDASGQWLTHLRSWRQSGRCH